MVMVIIGILAALAIPKLSEVVEKARIARAIGDVKAIGRNLQEYEIEHGVYPVSLSQLGMGELEDPWGATYRYLRFESSVTNGNGNGKGKGGGGGGGGGGGKPRKDRFLHPINTHFDLYSIGADGNTNTPLTAKASHDDIIWANDGGYVGLAEGY